MTCNHCLPPCECGAEEAAGLRLLSAEVLAAVGPPLHYADAYRAVCEPQWPELEAMEAALANYYATQEAA